jgi:hypothetical protein
MPDSPSYRDKRKQANQAAAIHASGLDQAERFALLRGVTFPLSATRSRNVANLLLAVEQHAKSGPAHEVGWLAGVLRVSRRTLQLTQRDAERLGVLHVRRRRRVRGGQRANEYSIDWAWLREYRSPGTRPGRPPPEPRELVQRLLFADEPPGRKVCAPGRKPDGAERKPCAPVHYMSARATAPSAAPDSAPTTSPSSSPSKSPQPSRQQPKTAVPAGVWAQVEVGLRNCGVSLWQAAADAARTRGESPDDAKAAINFFVDHPGAWRDVGALYHRMMTGIWPEMERGYARRQREQFDNALSTKAANIYATARDRDAPTWVYLLAAVLIDMQLLDRASVITVCRETRDAGGGFVARLQELCTTRGVSWWTPESGLRDQVATLGQAWDLAWDWPLEDFLRCVTDDRRDVEQLREPREKSKRGRDEFAGPGVRNRGD